MRITHISTWVVRVPPRRDHNWASKMKTPIGRHVIARMDTDEAIAGWGEAPALASWGGAHMMYYGETAETVIHMVKDYFSPILVGRNPLEISLLLDELDKVVKGHPYAKALIDMCLFDIAGKAMNVPVYQLLGGGYRDRVRVAHSLGIMENSAAVAEAETAVAEGVRTIKLKCGLDAERDVALVKDIRRAVGEAVEIRVDANEGYPSAKAAISIIRRMEEHGILLAEQPVADLGQMAEIAGAIDTPVMADESAWTPQDILRIMELGAAEMISLYVTKPGGLHRASKLAAVAEAGGIVSDIGGSVELGVGNAANLHLGAATKIAHLASVCPVSTPAGTGAPKVAGIYYKDDIIAEPFRYEDGCVFVPQGPGLGIEVDEEKLRQYSE